MRSTKESVPNGTAGDLRGWDVLLRVAEDKF